MSFITTPGRGVLLQPDAREGARTASPRACGLTDPRLPPQARNPAPETPPKIHKTNCTTVVVQYAAVNAISRALAPAGVPSTATSAAAVGADSARRASRAERVCRYFTAVPFDHAPGEACAMTKASAVWPNVGAGNGWTTPGLLLPQGIRHFLRQRWPFGSCRARAVAAATSA